MCSCRDRNELQTLIAALQEQKSHPGEKSRSATPSTIESDVASVEGLWLGFMAHTPSVFRITAHRLGPKKTTF